MKTDTDLLTALRAALLPTGLNQVGVASVEAYDQVTRPPLRSTALLPGARSIIVVGSGGPALWQAFVADLRADPRGLTDHAHPLDRYVDRCIAAADRTLEPAREPTRRRWLTAGDSAPPFVDLRTLAVLAGLGDKSRLGLVLNAQMGPWLGLRAACFVDLALTPSAPAADLCAGCSAPCQTACPGAAFVDGQWQVDRCAAFHREASTCHGICHARLACPIGTSQRYPEVERRYHDDRIGGRAGLRALLGIDPADDPYQGDGPHWDAWG